MRHPFIDLRRCHHILGIAMRSNGEVCQACAPRPVSLIRLCLGSVSQSDLSAGSAGSGRRLFVSNGHKWKRTALLKKSIKMYCVGSGVRRSAADWRRSQGLNQMSDKTLIASEWINKPTALLSPQCKANTEAKSVEKIGRR